MGRSEAPLPASASAAASERLRATANSQNVVNGRASIVRDEEILQSVSARGKQPLVAITVEVEECFLHCPKAFRRSQLWEPEAWPDRSVLPSMACVLYEKLKPVDKSLEEYVRESEEGIQRTLY